MIDTDSRNRNFYDSWKRMYKELYFLVLESTLKRCQKIYNTNNNSIALDISKVTLYENINEIKKSSLEAIISFMDKNNIKKSISIVDKLTKFDYFNIKECNRNIADYFLKKGSYGLFNNFE